MIRILAVFVFLTVITGVGIHLFRQLTGAERWQLTKTLAYSIMCSVIAIAVMVGLVIFF